MRPFCIWITGRPGCGKSTVTNGLQALLQAAGIDVVVLNLDRLRRILTPEPSYTEEERSIVYRALALMAHLLVERGARQVVIDATGHRRRFRDLARSLIPEFAEVYLACPAEVCEAREAGRKSRLVQTELYRKARGGRLKGQMPGVDVPYEEPLQPELAIPIGEIAAEEAARRIFDYIERRWGSARI